MRSTLRLQLQGFAPAFQQVQIELVSEATGKTINRKPFRDGSLLVRNLDPGDYKVVVNHPNLFTPIDVRKVKLFAQRPAARLQILIPEFLFQDSPIRDIPDADLGPIQQTAAAVSSQIGPIAGKAPGEVIRSSDWNTLAGAVEDLAGAVGELARLASPTGHDHPEFAERIDQVQDVIRSFSGSVGRSMLELRREIEVGALRNDLIRVLDVAQASSLTRTRLLARLTQLDSATQAEPPVFTGKISAFGGQLLSALNALAQAQGENADEFLANPEVKALMAFAGHYSRAGTQLTAESELDMYRRTGASIPGSKLARLTISTG